MANINRVSVNFDVNGIMTTYYVDSPDHDNINIELKDEDEPLEEDKEEPEEVKDEEVKIDEPKLESDSKQNTFSDNEMEYIYKKPEGGQGIIESVNGGGFYSVRRINYSDIDPTTFAGGSAITGRSFETEWGDVRNLSESINSPGLLLQGTRVNVNIFSESEQHGPYLAYMEVPIPSSAPGVIFSVGVGNPSYAVSLVGGVWNVVFLESVVNTQEPAGHTGRLLVGTPVDVQLQNGGDGFYLSHAPQIFAPPMPGE